MGDDILGEMNELMKEIDDCMGHAHVLASHVGRGIAGREVSLAITNLQQVKHWLRDASELWQNSMSEGS